MCVCSIIVYVDAESNRRRNACGKSSSRVGADADRKFAKRDVIRSQKSIRVRTSLLHSDLREDGPCVTYCVDVTLQFCSLQHSTLQLCILIGVITYVPHPLWLRHWHTLLLRKLLRYLSITSNALQKVLQRNEMSWYSKRCRFLISAVEAIVLCKGAFASTHGRKAV